LLFFPHYPQDPTGSSACGDTAGDKVDTVHRI
jgi:hypothetical protein